MQRSCLWTIAGVAAFVTAAGASSLSAQDQDKYSRKVPGGLALAEFKGYETWEVVSVSQGAPGILAVIMANPTMIAAYKAGSPGNGKPWPDGARMAKVHYNTKKLETFSAATVAGSLHDIDFMVKDSKRFADSGGWGYAAFLYDTLANKYSPATTAAMPPQGNDAKCGFGCHATVKTRDYVFTDYHAR